MNEIILLDTFEGACQWAIFVNLKYKTLFFPYPIIDQDKCQLVFKVILAKYIKDIHAFILKALQFKKVANIEKKINKLT